DANIVGESARPMLPQINSGRNAVLMDLARQDEQNKQYQAAKERYLQILTADPQYAPASSALAADQAIIDSRRGMEPSPAVLELSPQIESNKVDVATLNQNGKF